MVSIDLTSKCTAITPAQMVKQVSDLVKLVRQLNPSLNQLNDLVFALEALRNHQLGPIDRWAGLVESEGEFKKLVKANRKRLIAASTNLVLLTTLMDGLPPKRLSRFTHAAIGLKLITSELHQLHVDFEFLMEHGNSLVKALWKELALAEQW